jgi:hypothetical protein
MERLRGWSYSTVEVERDVDERLFRFGVQSAPELTLMFGCSTVTCTPATSSSTRTATRCPWSTSASSVVSAPTSASRWAS